MKTRPNIRRLAAGLVLSLGASGALVGVADPARADEYTRTECGGSYKDPINLIWNSRHSVARVMEIHSGTGTCDGKLSQDDICGTEQTYAYTSSECKHSYKKPCTKRDSKNHRRYHSRIYRSGSYNEVPSHQDQGCAVILGVATKDGARFNEGRDNQKAKVSASGCQAGRNVYWGNTLSIAQECGVGNQSSDGYVWYVL